MTEVDRDRVTASWGAEGGRWAVLVHGGAGDVPAERVARHVDGCRAAAQAARRSAARGGTALDAVERAVVVMEDDPSFNAGTGACLNEDGLIELDASLMEGSRLRAGGVCALPPFLHPIAIARAVLEDGQHVLYAGEGAARFAVAHGFTPSTTQAMTTELARARWEAARAKPGHDGWAGGTVGAVARDARGTVAAATSTGGRIEQARRAGGGHARPRRGQLRGRRRRRVLGDGRRRGGAPPLPREERGGPDARAGASRGGRARGHPSDGGRDSPATGGVILVDRTGRLGFARNTRTMTWAAAGERLQERRGGRLIRLCSGDGGTGLAVDRVLHAVAQPLRALDALGLERRGQPLVTLPHVPDCAVRHVEAAQFARNPPNVKGFTVGVNPGRE